jgi:iron(III) transport system permease protein
MPLPLLLLALVAVVSAPGLYILGLGLAQFSPEWWSHLAGTVLPGYLADSVLVAGGATLVALALGGPPAWLTFRYVFPGRGWCLFTQLLPLTLPAYVAAGLYMEAFSADFFYSRWALVMELGAGAAPLVFLFLRLALARLPAALFDTAASFGHGPLARFWRVGLPLLAMPLIAAACLVAAEALGEFGASSRLGITTLSVGLHDQWHALQRQELATMLALILFLLAALLATPVIRLGLQGQRAHHAGSLQTLQPLRASAPVALGIHLACLLAVLPGFWGPLWLALGWARERLDRTNLAPLFGDAGNTLATALACVAVCLALTLLFAYLLEAGERARRSDRSVWLVAVNYLTPSMVLALAWLASGLTGHGVIILATSVKLLPLVLLPVADALARVPAAQVETARGLGQSRFQTWYRVLLPQLGPVLAGGVLLVFVLAATELTLSLALQPFGYGALSLRIFAWAGIQMTQLASVWVICLCLLCLYPVWRLSRLIDHAGAHHA